MALTTFYFALALLMGTAYLLSEVLEGRDYGIFHFMVPVASSI
jgi:hypothetical protein